MTVDQREGSRGRLLLAEGSLGHFGHFANTPFPNGILKVYSNEDSGWTVNNDSNLITFIHSDKTINTLQKHDNAVINKFWDYPVLGGVFTSRMVKDSTGESYHITTIPTTNTANRLVKDVFKDVPTAGIELVQTSNTDRVPLTEYLNYLMSGKLPVSSGYSMYRHDLFDHWLGAVTIKDREFEVFKALCREIGPIGLKFGREEQVKYMEGLGTAFDFFSGGIFDNRLRREQGPNWSLPGQCLAQLRGSKAYHQSEQLVASFDTADNPLLRTVGNGSYYGKVFKAFRQPRWTLQPVVR